MDHLEIREDQWERMRAHVESCLPHEGCGLLAGKGDRVEEVIPIANQAGSATRFRMDAREQIRAFGHMEARDRDLVGIFHSHPALPGPNSRVQEEPSPTDISEAAYPVVQVLWSRPSGQWAARGFWIEPGGVSEVELRIVRIT